MDSNEIEYCLNIVDQKKHYWYSTETPEPRKLLS